jgi:hypothetical protein
MLIPPFRARRDGQGKLVWPAHVLLLALASAVMLGAGTALWLV